MATTETIKEIALSSISQLPDDATLEQIMYELHFIAKVLEGHADAEQKRVITMQDLRQLRKQWRQ